MANIAKRSEPLSEVAFDLIRMSKRKEVDFKKQIPWEVKRTGLDPDVYGSQISFTQDGDYLDLDEAREAVAWLVTQLGGKVTWRVY
jgi:hypothetical protein